MVYSIICNFLGGEIEVQCQFCCQVLRMGTARFWTCPKVGVALVANIREAKQGTRGRRMTKMTRMWPTRMRKTRKTKVGKESGSNLGCISQKPYKKKSLLFRRTSNKMMRNYSRLSQYMGLRYFFLSVLITVSVMARLSGWWLSIRQYLHRSKSPKQANYTIFFEPTLTSHSVVNIATRYRLEDPVIESR